MLPAALEISLLACPGFDALPRSMRLDVCSTGPGYQSGFRFPLNSGEDAGVRFRTDGKLVFLVEVEPLYTMLLHSRALDTRVASARRRTKPLREGVVGLQL